MARSPRTFIGATMAAGAVGGFIAAWFKLGWDVTWMPLPVGRMPEPMGLVSLFTHVPAPIWVAYIIHFGLSILAGIAYGALVEFFPIVAIGAGVGFGIAVWVGAHEIILPLLRLTPAAWKLPVSEQLSQLLGHALWGLVIGVFCRDLRRGWVKPIRKTIREDVPLTASIPESIAVYHK